MRVFIPKHGLLLLNQMPGSIGHKFLKQANFTIGLGSHSKLEPLKAQCAMFLLHMRKSGGESYQCHKARTGLNWQVKRLGRTIQIRPKDSLLKFMHFRAEAGEPLRSAKQKEAVPMGNRSEAFRSGALIFSSPPLPLFCCHRWSS
jgi:hypothetical protein